MGEGLWQWSTRLVGPWGQGTEAVPEHDRSWDSRKREKDRETVGEIGPDLDSGRRKRVDQSCLGRKLSKQGHWEGDSRFEIDLV